MLSTVYSALSDGSTLWIGYALNTGTESTDHRFGGCLFRVQDAPARPLFLRLLDAGDARTLNKPKNPADDNTGSSDSQEHQDSHGHTGRAASPPFPWNLDFYEFVSYAVGQEPEEDDYSNGWHSRLWNFTRLLRGWHGEGSTALSVFRAVSKAIRSEYGSWDEALGLTEEEAHFEFTLAWKKIRWRCDESALDQALLKAKKFPFGAPKVGDEKRPTPGYDRFVCLVFWLQFTRGDKTIFLPVREVAKLLETDQRMVSLWRQQAIEDGILVLVQAHQYKPGSKGRATEFKVAEAFWSWFTKFHADKVK